MSSVAELVLNQASWQEDVLADVETRDLDQVS